MRRRKLLYGLGASGAVLVPSGLTAAAYNSFTVDRKASIGVVGDQAGIIQLEPGGSNAVVKNDGALEIDLSSLGGSGQNVDSKLVVGDPNDAASTYAFSVSNPGTKSPVTVSYILDENPDTDPTTDPSGGTDPDTDNPNVNFEFFDNTGASLSKTLSEGGSVDLSISGGTTYYVVLTVNTFDSTPNADLSGVLRFQV